MHTLVLERAEVSIMAPSQRARDELAHLGEVHRSCRGPPPSRKRRTPPELWGLARQLSSPGVLHVHWPRKRMVSLAMAWLHPRRLPLP